MCQCDEQRDCCRVLAATCEVSIGGREDGDVEEQEEEDGEGSGSLLLLSKWSRLATECTFFVMAFPSSVALLKLYPQ